MIISDFFFYPLIITTLFLRSLDLLFVSVLFYICFDLFVYQLHKLFMSPCCLRDIRGFSSKAQDWCHSITYKCTTFGHLFKDFYVFFNIANKWEQLFKSWRYMHDSNIESILSFFFLSFNCTLISLFSEEKREIFNNTLKMSLS